LKYYLNLIGKKESLNIGNLVLVNLIPVITQLSILKIISTSISTSEFGLFTLLLTFNILITQIFSNGLIGATARFYGSPSYDTNLFLSNYLSIFVFNFLIIAFFSILSSLIFYSLMGVAFSINILIIIVTSIFDIFFQSFLSLSNKINRRNHVLLYSFVYNFLKMLGIYFIYFFGLLNIRSILIVYLSVTLLIDLILFISKSNKILEIKINIKRENLKNEMFEYIKPFYVTGLFSFLFFVADKWIIGLFLNEHILGVYSIYYQIGYAPFTYLALIFTMFLSPIIFNKIDSENVLVFNSKDLVIPFVIFILIVISISFFLKDYIVLALSDKKYLDYSYFIVFMAISGSLFLLAQILNLFFLAKKKVYLLGKIQFLGSIFSIFSLFLFLKYIPHSYLPISFILTNLFIVVLLYYFECQN
jgi:O-antigen/teichoic acid export membrane protein